MVPGVYRVRLTVSGATHAREVRVDEDPRIQVGPAERRTWTRTLLEVADMYRETNGWIASMLPDEADPSVQPTPPSDGVEARQRGEASHPNSLRRPDELDR